MHEHEPLVATNLLMPVLIIIGVVVLVKFSLFPRMVSLLARALWGIVRGVVKLCGILLWGLVRGVGHSRPHPGGVIGPARLARAVDTHGDYRDYSGLALPGELAGRTSGGVPIGRYLYPSGRRGRRVHIDLDLLYRGAAVVGPSGSGKTVGILLPWIESLLAQGQSVVTVDIKGDLYDQVGVSAQRHGAALWYWNCTDPRSMRWNWLDRLDDERDIEAVVRATLGKAKSADTQPFFHERDHRWLRAIIGVARASSTHPVPSELLRLAADQQGLRDAFEANPDARALQYQIGDLLTMAQRDFSVAVSGLLNALNLCASADVRRICEASDFRLDDIVSRPTALVIGAPLADGCRSEVLSSIMLNMLFNRVYRNFNNHPDRRGLFFLIDEAPRLRDRISFEEAGSVVRAARAGLCLAMQDITQLGSADERASILANCASLIVLRGSSEVTARFVRDKLGERNRSSVSHSRTGRPFEILPSHRTQTIQMESAAVLSEREIMHPPRECGPWCACVHVPAMTAKPFLVDVTASDS